MTLTLWTSVYGYQGIKHLRISNWLILGDLLIPSIYLYVKESSLTGATVNMAMTASFIGICLSLPDHLLDRLGAADVKYLVALGLVSDPLTVLYSLALGCLLCIVLSILVRSFKRSAEKSAMNEEVHLRRAPSKNKLFSFIFAMSTDLLAHLVINKIIWVNLRKTSLSGYILMANTIRYGYIPMHVPC